MTSKYEDFEQDKSALGIEELPADCFELLSAYIDGEASSSQRHQVQQWLDTDPKIKRLYTQLLALQGQMQHSMAPPSKKSTAEITAGVFQSIDNSRRRQRRVVWTGTAIAASLVAAITSMVSGNALRMNIARENPADSGRAVMLAVALDKPAINIPKTVSGYNLYGPPMKPVN